MEKKPAKLIELSAGRLAQWSIYEMLLRARALDRFHVIDGLPNLTTRRYIHRA
jgi:hypothetical protein